ncbi:hypothetical protein KI387_004972, partial [Taxus chinensis]
FVYLQLGIAQSSFLALKLHCGDAVVMEKPSTTPLLAPSDLETSPEDYVPPRFSSHFFRQVWEESKKLWFLAAPVAFNRICTYAFGVVTQSYAGQFGTLELAAVSLASSTIGGISLGLMVGMSSAQQTLSGQAFGAKKFNMLGVYLQQSFVIMNGMALLFSLLYIFAAPLLKAVGQSEEVADLTGQFALWSLPQLFAYANYFPVQKFFQSQRIVMMQAVICGGSLVCHIFLNWLLITKLGFGLLALAMALNASWWLVAIGQFIYVLTGPFPETWTGFSVDIFHDVWSFLKLSGSSAGMACVDLWYYRVLALVTGNLRNPKIAVDSFSICLSVYEGLTMFNSRAATSVIISNELGAGRPKRTQFVAFVCLITSVTCGIVFFTGILIARNDIASFFTSDVTVRHMVYELAIFVAFTELINSVQPVLTGVAVGAGWQAFVAKVNIVCYYLIGVPTSALLGFKFNLQVKMETFFLDKYQDYCRGRDRREEFFQMKQKEDENLEDYLDRFLFVHRRSGYELNAEITKTIFLKGLDDETKESLHLMGGGDLHKLSMAHIAKLYRSYSRTKGSLRRRKTSKNALGTSELLEEMTNMKTYILSQLTSTIDGLKAKNNVAKEPLDIYCPRCRKRHPLKECPLDITEMCLIYDVPDHDTNHCTLLP